MKRITAAMIVSALRKADPITSVTRETDLKLYLDLELLGLVIKRDIVNDGKKPRNIGAFSISSTGKSVSGTYWVKCEARGIL